MKNKNYYMDLADRWFDAFLTGGEERELKSFLATTEDPDFDEIKAVAGFFVAGKAIATSGESRTVTRSSRGLRNALRRSMRRTVRPATERWTCA